MKPFTGTGGLPGAPTIAQAQSNDLPQDDDFRSVTVTLVPPLDNGGNAITGYTVYSVPGGGKDGDAGSAGTTHTIDGLDEHVPYVFYARASNAAGIGPLSAPTQPLTLVPGQEPKLLSFVGFTYQEGDFGTYIAEIRIHSDRSADGVSFRLSTLDGSATAGTDYLPASTVLHFPKGSLISEPLLVPIVGDMASEADESFQVQVTEIQGASMANPVMEILIRDDDPVGTRLSIGHAEVTETDQGSVVASVPVQLSQAQGSPVTFDVRTAWTFGATPGVDYDELTLTGQSIPAGQTTGQVLVTRPRRHEVRRSRVGHLAVVERAGRRAGDDRKRAHDPRQ